MLFNLVEPMGFEPRVSTVRSIINNVCEDVLLHLTWKEKEGKTWFFNHTFSSILSYWLLAVFFVNSKSIWRKIFTSKMPLSMLKKDTLSQRPFTIIKDALQIYYQNNEIAHHSTGMPIFKIPFSKLHTCLRYKFQ
jgi:hypothetical protein